MAGKKARGSGGVKAFVVDISPLEVETWKGKYAEETGEPIFEKAKLPVPRMLMEWLFHPQRGLTYVSGGIEARRCAELIHDAKGKKTVTLNEDQYKNLKEAVETAPGIGFDSMKVVDRVLNAKETTLAVG